VTGATGAIGSRLVRALRERGDDVTVLSRDPARAGAALGVAASAWDPLAEPAPVAALAGRDAVVHLAGENIAQRWTEASRRAIHDSRSVGTRNLVAGLKSADPRPPVLVSASAIGFYGPHGDERLDESAAPGEDFVAAVVRDWEAAAQEAEVLGMRVARIRTGIVLDGESGALRKMLPPFKAGVGGPVAGGAHYMSWIHLDDVVGIMVKALDGAGWTGAINATAPEPVTNGEFSKALGRALHRPALAPVPALALRLLYGDMSAIVTTGQRVVPKRALELGYAFRHPDLDEALRSALGRGGSG